MRSEICARSAAKSSPYRPLPRQRPVTFRSRIRGAVSLRFANGVLGTFMLSDTAAAPRSWEQTTGEDSAFSSYPDEDCYIVAGTLGSLAFPTMRLRFYADPATRKFLRGYTRHGGAGGERARRLAEPARPQRDTTGRSQRTSVHRRAVIDYS